MRAALFITLCACGGAVELVPTPVEEAPAKGLAPAPGVSRSVVAEPPPVIVIEEELDAGAPVIDAGSPPPPVDAGAPPPPVDAGSPPPPVDAGSPPPPFDAGSPPPPPVDAGSPPPPGPGAALSVHTTLGLPSNAQVGQLDDWLLKKPQLVIAYDTLHKVPHWVSWELTSAWLGDAPRSSGFRKDAQLPSNTAQAADSDYTNSGYDRGHMCPSADRTATSADNSSTFVLTNAVPQTHQNNAGPWESLEEESRNLAGLGKRLFIVSGPLFGASRTTIGNGVEVPLSTWKVVVVLDAASTTVSSATRVIAVVMPNTMSISGGWRNFRTTVDALEQQTGLDLLADVDAAVQSVVEARLDTQ